MWREKVFLPTAPLRSQLTTHIICKARAKMLPDASSPHLSGHSRLRVCLGEVPGIMVQRHPLPTIPRLGFMTLNLWAQQKWLFYVMKFGVVCDRARVTGTKSICSQWVGVYLKRESLVAFFVPSFGDGRCDWQGRCLILASFIRGRLDGQDLPCSLVTTY